MWLRILIAGIFYYLNTRKASIEASKSSTGPLLSSEKQPTRDFWTELLSEFNIQTYRSTWSIFSQAYALFGQAAEIIKVKAYASVGLLCRSTLESACYVYLTRKKKGSVLTFDPPHEA